MTEKEDAERRIRMKIIKEGRNILVKTVKVTCQMCNAELEIEREDVSIEQCQFEPGVMCTDYIYVCPCCKRKNHLDYEERSQLGIN